MLIGREREIAILRAVIDEARNGGSAVIVFTGEAGIGKTALLRHAAELADDLPVVTTTGIEGESDIPYAHLADALRPYYSEIKRLPERQAAALASAFAIGPAMPTDRFVISVAVLNLLSNLAADQPLVVLADDLQWIDRNSRDALLFVAHRLNAEAIAVLFAMRSGSDEELRLDRFHTVKVTGLDDASCRRLIRSSSIAHARVCSGDHIENLIRGSGGNPLALIALQSPTEFQNTGWAYHQRPLPLTSRLERAFIKNLAGLTDSTREALLLLAVLGSVPETVLDRVLSARKRDPSALDEAESAGLIVRDGAQPAFAHPLVRSAVYQSASPHQRRQIHREAADALSLAGGIHAAERRAWHVFASGVEFDVSLAAELESTGDHHLAAANLARAGLAFRQSALLTSQPTTKITRLIKAAHSSRLAGEIDECRSLLVAAQDLDPDAATEALVAYLLCRIDLWAGDKRTSRDRLRELATKQQLPCEIRAQMHADVALASAELGDLAVADHYSALAVDACGVPSGQWPLGIVAVRAIVTGLRGESHSSSHLAHREAEVLSVNPVSVDTDEQLQLLAGIAYLAGEDVRRARTVLQRSVDAARAHSALGMLPFRLSRLATAEIWDGEWALAAAHAGEALVLASDTGWDAERGGALATCARVEALLDQEENCRAHAAEALAASTTAGAWSYATAARAALGSLHLARRELDLALEQYVHVEAFVRDTGLVDTPLLWWTSDFVECLVAAGHPEDAGAVLSLLPRVADLTERPALRAVIARSRALVEPERSIDHLTEAMRWHRLASAPFERARTQHLLGSALRRRRDAGARAVLAEALATFERLGARHWAERPRAELRAAGVRLPQPTSALNELTPQELQVVVAVARGHSNAEVAGQLFLSVKTVEYHLNKAFRKLGATRRGQLATLLNRFESQESNAGARD